MNAFDALVAKADEKRDEREVVIGEIINYFGEYLKSSKFDDYLLRWADTTNRRVSVNVSFWRYMSGCSDTYFRVGGLLWHNPENESGYESEKYKSVCLDDIDDTVGRELSCMVKATMKEKGFRCVENKDERCWLGFYDMNHIFAF